MKTVTGYYSLESYRIELDMNSPSYAEIAADYKLWMEYVDPSGHDTEAAFAARTIDENLAFIVQCFGPELAKTKETTP